MDRCLLLSLIFFAGLFPGVATGILSAEDPSPVNLIRLGGRNPWFISLEISQDRLPLSKLRSAQFQELFEVLDANSDSALDESEFSSFNRRALPAFSPSNRNDWWRSSDRSPADGKISRDEFQSLESVILGSPVQLQFLPPRQSQAFDLSGKLDVDRDGKASFAEILYGSRQLAKFDLNEDGSLAAEELVPPGTLPASVSAGSADRIWSQISETNRSEIAARLLREFDRLPSGNPDRQLSLPELGFSEDRFSRFDGDGNRHLDLSELEKLLTAPPIDLRITLQLRSNSFLRPKFELQSLNDSIKPSILPNKFMTPIDGVDVTWVARGTTITPDDAIRFYRQRFLQADADSNGYLNEQEFATLQIPSTSFATVDRNSDDQLYPDELVAYLKLQVLLTQGRVTLICSNETKSLFELLDQDSDRRLSAGEFQNSRRILSAEDRNGDGAISPEELAEEQSVVAEYNRSSMLEFAARSTDRTPLRSVTRQTLSGPLWFQKMDRNRDGFVTRKEFLGPLDLFSRMDLDGNDTVDEAEAAREGK